MRVCSSKRACWTAVAAMVVSWLAMWDCRVAIAQDAKPPSAADGRGLAERFCKSCHLISSEAATANVGPPSFRAIANKPGQTAESIKGVLIQPHHPMPDLHLTNEEILDIIAYLDTFREAEKVPPLLPPQGGVVPKSPSRS